MATIAVVAAAAYWANWKRLERKDIWNQQRGGWYL